MNVLTSDDKKLHQVCTEVIDYDNYDFLINEMKELLKDDDAYGIAAPQLGILKQIIAINDGKKINIYFNPKIISMQGVQFYYESCMSVINTIGLVRRPYLIEIEAQDKNGNYIHKLLDGMDAITFCHEYDHLNGVLFTDIASNIINNVNKSQRIKIRNQHPRQVIDKTKPFKYGV